MLEDTSNSPKLLISSEQAHWEEMTLYAYHEPAELEGWTAPGMLDSSLLLITRGGLRLETKPINGPWEAHTLSQGDLLLKPGTLQSNEIRWHSFSSEPLHILYLSLSHTLLTRTAEAIANGNPAHLTLVERAGFQDPLLTQLGLALWRELEHPDPARLYAQTAAQMLAVHLLQHYTSAPAIKYHVSSRLAPHQLNHLFDFILTHLNQDLSLETLAQQVGFSPYHFARLFHQTTGESPHQFVLHQRIERAKQLLRETTMPLTQVALESGFANQSHLARVFKRHLNLTPRTYRQDSSIRAYF